jgi:2-oxo-3-hexenedioate decarboxylase
MAPQTKASDLKGVAGSVIAALTSHRQIPTFSSRPNGLTLAQAYRVIPLLRAAFEARGEKITGRKIGFTNHEMWKVYGVEAPIWGYVTDQTTRELAHVQIQSIKNFVEPRIEPEIMFGLKAAPWAGMNEAALLDCVEWVSLGYEIVQSIFPGWKFTAADTVAANGVHGALLVGKRHAIAPQCGKQRATYYSITSSISASSEGESTKPSACAFFRLSTTGNFVGCSTGRSAGFAPLRILST